MTYIQVSFCSKVGFFSGLKTGRSDHPQTLRPAFLVNCSGILQLKNTALGLIGTQEMCISSLKSGHDPYLREQNEEQP